MNYVIVRTFGDELDHEEHVKEFLAQGWRLEGGVSVCLLPAGMELRDWCNSKEDDPVADLIFFQAMSHESDDAHDPDVND